MLKRPRDTYIDLIWEAAARVGRNASKITSDIIDRAFPETVKASEGEGVFNLFKHGVMADVKRVIRGAAPDETQIDFATIDPSFHELVRDLRHRAYHVEALDCQVPIHDLISDPALLDDARKFMRKKGMECLDEAGRLDALYRAVTDAPSLV